MRDIDLSLLLFKKQYIVLLLNNEYNSFEIVYIEHIFIIIIYSI